MMNIFHDNLLTLSRQVLGLAGTSHTSKINDNTNGFPVLGSQETQSLEASKRSRVLQTVMATKDAPGQDHYESHEKNVGLNEPKHKIKEKPLDPAQLQQHGGRKSGKVKSGSKGLLALDENDGAPWKSANWYSYHDGKTRSMNMSIKSRSSKDAALEALGRRTDNHLQMTVEGKLLPPRGQMTQSLLAPVKQIQGYTSKSELQARLSGQVGISGFSAPHAGSTKDKRPTTDGRPLPPQSSFHNMKMLMMGKKPSVGPLVANSVMIGKKPKPPCATAALVGGTQAMSAPAMGRASERKMSSLTYISFAAPAHRRRHEFTKQRRPSSFTSTLRKGSLVSFVRSKRSSQLRKHLNPRQQQFAMKLARNGTEKQHGLHTALENIRNVDLVTAQSSRGFSSKVRDSKDLRPVDSNTARGKGSMHLSTLRHPSASSAKSSAFIGLFGKQIRRRTSASAVAPTAEAVLGHVDYDKKKPNPASAGESQMHLGSLANGQTYTDIVLLIVSFCPI
jgi:hypothetical protein